MRVLVVEDDDVSAELLENALQQFGYDVTTACNGREAYDLIRTGEYRLVVSDVEMPEWDGIELCKQIRSRPSSSYTYVILLTSRAGTQNIVSGLNAGADDYVVKPFHPQELHLRLRVGERILSLESRNLVIFTLAKLADSRDPQTGAHLERMREYSRLLAHGISRKPKYADVVDGEYVQMIYLTSPLHDIGKVGIPDTVLLKPGRLTPDEFEIMKQHTVIGGQTLEAALSAYPEAQFLQMACDIAWTHHERFDGTGYPRQIAGTDIPLCGRIVALADVYDALTTPRIYKPAYSHDVARSIILDGKAKHFDPDIVETFLEMEDEFIEVHRRMAADLDDNNSAVAGGAHQDEFA